MVLNVILWQPFICYLSCSPISLIYLLHVYIDMFIWICFFFFFLFLHRLEQDIQRNVRRALLTRVWVPWGVSVAGHSVDVVSLFKNKCLTYIEPYIERSIKCMSNFCLFLMGRKPFAEVTSCRSAPLDITKMTVLFLSISNLGRPQCWKLLLFSKIMVPNDFN